MDEFLLYFYIADIYILIFYFLYIWTRFKKDIHIAALKTTYVHTYTTHIVHMYMYYSFIKKSESADIINRKYKIPTIYKVDIISIKFFILCGINR